MLSRDSELNRIQPAPPRRLARRGVRMSGLCESGRNPKRSAAENPIACESPTDSRCWRRTCIGLVITDAAHLDPLSYDQS